MLEACCHIERTEKLEACCHMRGSSYGMHTEGVATLNIQVNFHASPLGDSFMVRLHIAYEPLPNSLFIHYNKSSP
jgi:hypothetical protein